MLNTSAGVNIIVDLFNKAAGIIIECHSVQCYLLSVCIM